MAITLDTPAPLIDAPEMPNIEADGIPQSFAPPSMTEAFGENPWDVEAREESARRDEMLSGALAKIDKAALDPEAYFAGQDMSLSLNYIVDQRAATVEAFLRLQNGGERFDTSPNPLANDLTRATIRQRVAHTLFDGRGADDDDAFFLEIRNSAQNRIDRRTLGSTLATKAHTAAIVSLTDPEKAKEFSWPAFREEARKAPGYSPDDEASLYEAYHASRSESDAAIASFAPELKNIFEAMKAGPAGNFSQVAQAVIGDMLGQNPDKPMGRGREELAKKDAPRLALDTYYELTEEERPQFMQALATLARSLPKEEQAAFFTNLAKQGGRDIDDLARNIGSIGIQNSSEEEFASRKAAMESRQGENPVARLLLGGEGGGLDAAFYDPAMEESMRSGQRKLLAARNFASDVRNIERQDYNPMKSAWGDEKMGILETGIYGVPGALASSVLAAVPYVGLPAMYSSMEGAAYDDIRRNLMASGMTDAAATAKAAEWATIAAVPQAALEKLQAAALVGKLPFLDKFFTSIGDKITSIGTRFAFRTTTGAVQETAIEAAQDFIPHITQELAATLSEEIPHVTWSNGKDGALDGWWTQQATTLVTMLPLAIIGAAGGVSADKRVQAFQNASDNTLLALGASREQLAELRAAQAKGIETYKRTLPRILDNLDPTSDTAKAAVEAEVAAELERQGVAAEATQSGILPRFTRTAEGWTLHDSETGAEIGTAPNAEAALRLAITHTDSIDEADANRFAYMVTMLEAGDFTALTESLTRKTTTDFRPGETVTAAQQAATSPEDAARVAAQIALREKMEGGTGEVAGVVFGQSSTTFENSQRRTVNRLNQGASVLTVFHEETHGFWREAVANGRLTQNDALSVLRALDTILAKKTTREGQAVRFLPADFDTLSAKEQETAIDEAISELMEAEVLRTRKGTGVRKIPAGIISRNLAALTRIAGGQATNKFRSFARALRAYFGIAIDRAASIDRGIKEGTIDQNSYNDFLNRLLGLEEQASLDQQARDFEQDIIEGTATPEAIPEGDPFAIGRSNERLDGTGKTEGIETNSPGGADIGDAASPSSVVTSEIEAAYLDAAQSGDLVEAQKLVDRVILQTIPKQPSGSYVLVKVTDLGTKRPATAIQHGEGYVAFVPNSMVKFGTWQNIRFRAFQEAIWPFPENVFLRVTHRKEDYEHLKNGTHRGSLNRNVQDWESPIEEGGLSVARALEIPAKYAYFVTGEVIGTGQDGDPLLSLDSAKPKGALLKYESALKRLKDAYDGADTYANLYPRKVSEISVTNTDPVLRDSSGNIIPLSQRFNQPSPAASGDSFAIGRTTVTPTASTQTFQGQDGQTVIGPASFSIGAWHGTPHKVDKFSTDKIGTGEGAQVFGWGLYFAKMRETANFYRNILAAAAMDVDPVFTPSDELVAEVNRVARGIDPRIDSVESMHADGYDWQLWGPYVENVGSEQIAGSAEVWAAIEGVKGKWNTVADQTEYEDIANLYRVTLNVEEEDLLDWDKPLAEQSGKVKAALGKSVSLSENLQWEQTAGKWYDGMSMMPELLSKALAEAGIPGIKFLDGDSRHSGQGSYNYVIFDGADIEILEENGQPVELGNSQGILNSSFSDNLPGLDFYGNPDDVYSDGVPFSLGPAALADAMRQGAIARIKDPQRRVRAMSNVARKMEDIHLVKARLELIHGSKRAKASLRKEAALREAALAEQYENEAYARHYGILDDDDLRKIKSQPVHSFLSNPDSHLHGVLMSKSAAIKNHPDLFRLHRAGDYDGSDGVSRSVFGGTRMPDQAAQDLYDANLIKEPTADALWQALRKEQAMVSTMKDLHAAAKEDIRSARTRAKQETNEWLAQQDRTQDSKFSPKQEVLSALALLDAILSSVSPEIRGKVGGYTQLAQLGSDKHRLTFLTNRLEQVDDLLEQELRTEFGKEMESLLKRARPQKDAPGEKPKGVAGSDVHDLFREVEKYMSLPMIEAEARAVGLESKVASGQLSPEEESHSQILADLLRLVGNWTKADAARRESAVTEATRIFAKGYIEHRIVISARSEARQRDRSSLKANTGKSGVRPERRKKAKEQATKLGRSFESLLSLLSFEQITQLAFGRDSEIGNRLVDWERRASYARQDSIDAKTQAIEDLFATITGSRYAGEKLRYEMGTTDTITVTNSRGKHDFTQLEAISATLMWMQADGRRHMEGHLDDAGNPIGEWGWTEADMAAIEDQLTDEAKAVRVHLQEQYGAEYDRLNTVYRDLNGINLPRNKFYSPLTVKPQSVQAGQVVDPVSGFAVSGGFSPGSLKTRSQSAVAEPDFRDALATYIGHTTQIEHYIAYAPFATEAMALVNTREVGNAVEASAGKETIAILRKWLDQFSQGGNRDAGAYLAFNQGLNRAASRVATAALVGRVSVLAIQSTQLGAALAQMPTGSYLSRFAKLTTGQLGWGEAIKSDYIQRRVRQMPPIVRQAMEGLQSAEPNRIKHAMANLARTISGADALFTAGTYAIIYDYQKSQGLTGQALIEATERSVERVAQPVRTGTRSLYEVTGSGNPSTRILWAFASEPRQKLALVGFELATGTASSKARAFAVAWIMGGVVASLIRTVMRDIRDSDDEEIFDERNWSPKRLALMSLTGPLGGLPIAGDLLETAAFKAAGEYIPEGNLFSSVGGVLRLKNVPDWFTGDRDADEIVGDIDAILTSLAPVSDTNAAAAAAFHIVKDAEGIIRNLFSLAD